MTNAFIVMMLDKSMKNDTCVLCVGFGHIQTAVGGKTLKTVFVTIVKKRGKSRVVRYVG